MKKTETPKKKITNLFLVGNGFDRWQGLPTSYDKFRLYYQKNIKRIMREMHVPWNAVKDKRGKTQFYNPVDIIYGNPFDNQKPNSEFFSDLENSMGKLDDQLINLYFGKSNRGLYKLQKTIDYAQRLLQYSFGQWIASIEIESKSVPYIFGNNCYFINFNYTKTLQKRFGVDDSYIYHIHGEANDPETIIVGHATHPEMPFGELMTQDFIYPKSQRLRGLYMVESALYDTDKHIQDNIDDMCEFMTLDGVHIEDIENIYVLGMSFSDPDKEYFDFFNKVTKVNCDYNSLSALWKMNQFDYTAYDENQLMEDIFLNIQYASHHRERELGIAPLPFPEEEAVEKTINKALYGRENYYTEEVAQKAKEAVHRRFIMEQACRTKEVLEELCTIKHTGEIPEIAQCASVFKLADYIDGGHNPRKNNAKWHISYHSESDKERIEAVLSEIGCDNYELINGIDICLNEFMKKKQIKTSDKII